MHISDKSNKNSMTHSVRSFYKKDLLTRGTEKANQVLKRQKAKSAIAEITKKKMEKGLGRSNSSTFNDSVLILLLCCFTFSGSSSSSKMKILKRIIYLFIYYVDF